MVIAEREKNGPFASLEDFASRLDSKAVNRKILENLIKAGAFDFTLQRRDEMFSRVGQVVSGSTASQRDRASGQTSLFDMNELMSAAPAPDLLEEDKVEWNQREYLTHEKELLGFYVTGHPLDEFRKGMEKGGYEKIGDLQKMKPGGKLKRFAGLIGSAVVKYTKRDSKPFAILTVEDFTGTTEVMVWSEGYAKYNQLLEPGKAVVLKAKVEEDNRSDENRLTAEEVTLMEPDPDYQDTLSGPTGYSPAPNPVMSGGNGSAGQQSHHGKPVLLCLDAVRDTVAAFDTIRAAVKENPGDRPLQLQVRRANGQRVTLEAGASFCVSDSFVEEREIGMWVV